MRADNTRHLAQATARRQVAARARVVAALEEAHNLGEPLTLAAAARRAGVSRAYVYSQPDLVAAVRDLEAANAHRHPGTPTAQRSTPASLLARIEALTARNKALREENQTLRKKLAAAHGALRDQNLTTSSTDAPPRPATGVTGQSACSCSHSGHEGLATGSVHHVP